jgi:hypothetical protein
MERSARDRLAKLNGAIARLAAAHAGEIYECLLGVYCIKVGWDRTLVLLAVALSKSYGRNYFYALFCCKIVFRFRLF